MGYSPRGPAAASARPVPTPYSVQCWRLARHKCGVCALAGLALRWGVGTAAVLVLAPLAATASHVPPSGRLKKRQDLPPPACSQSRMFSSGHWLTKQAMEENFQ